MMSLFLQITSTPGFIERAAIEGQPDHFREVEGSACERSPKA
jgi:hypothetical protein